MKRLLKTVIPCLLIALPVFVLVDIGRYFFYPDVTFLKNNRPGKTAFMEHREKVWRSKNIKKKISVSWVPLSQISPYVVKAVIIAEDDKFWSHEGFDFEAMQKALEKNLHQKKFKMGGSTISQQLAKNLYLSPTKSPVRKVKEAILTWRIERELSKRRIMELYLNVAEWGDGLFGIRAAARRYYRKSPAALDAHEAAALAAALPSPRRFHPASGSRYASRRAARIYSIMERRGIVIREYEEVVGEEKENTKEEKTSPYDTGEIPLPQDLKLP